MATIVIAVRFLTTKDLLYGIYSVILQSFVKETLQKVREINKII